MKCMYVFSLCPLGDMEKEELRNALVLTQESAAIQILLECCLPTPQERASGSRLSALQESDSGHFYRRFIIFNVR